MQTVENLLKSPPSSPAFEKWFEEARTLWAVGGDLGIALSAWLGKIHAHHDATANARVISATISSGVTFPDLVEVEVWLTGLLSACERQKAAR